MQETTLLVFFDISDTKIRNRVNEKCKDYGLQKIQMSGFKGTLNKRMRGELIEAIKKIIGKEQAKVYVQPICGACLDTAFSLDNYPEEALEEEKIYFGMPLNQAYLHAED